MVMIVERPLVNEVAGGKGTMLGEVGRAAKIDRVERSKERPRLGSFNSEFVDEIAEVGGLEIAICQLEVRVERSDLGVAAHDGRYAITKGGAVGHDQMADHFERTPLPHIRPLTQRFVSDGPEQGSKNVRESLDGVSDLVQGGHVLVVSNEALPAPKYSPRRA